VVTSSAANVSGGPGAAFQIRPNRVMLMPPVMDGTTSFGGRLSPNQCATLKRCWRLCFAKA